VKVISCSAAYGSGGLGAALAQVVEEAREDGELLRYYAGHVRPGDDAGRVVRSAAAPLLCRYTPVRFSPGRRASLSAELFDHAVAHVLEPADALVAFAGHALTTFRRARELGYERLELVSPTCHVDHVAARHAAAVRLHPIERPWLDEAQRRRCVREYELADEIHVVSDYVYESFVDQGVPAERLRLLRHEPSPRFASAEREPDGAFSVVYVGALTVAKGLPVLLDAFDLLVDPRASLTLVGGWSTRGMRRFIEARIHRDSRIHVAPGDPLPHLRRADAYVHASWQDGFGLAVTEAMACGVPVIVTEDTGAKERVREGVDGWIVPTGDAAAIAERLVEIREFRRAAQAQDRSEEAPCGKL